MYEIDYQLTRADLAVYQTMALARLKAEARKKTSIWKQLALWIGLVILFAIGFNIAGETTSIDAQSMLIGTWIGLVLAAGLSMGTAYRLRSSIYSDTGPSLSPQHALFDEPGMHVTTALMSADYKWGLFTELSESKEHITLWMEPCLGLVIPTRAFSTSAAAAAFAVFARMHIAAAAATSRRTS